MIDPTRDRQGFVIQGRGDLEFIVAPEVGSSNQPAFEVVSRQVSNTVLSPRGDQIEPWWDERNIECRVARAALGPVQADLLRQDPQTCWLTSTMNAYTLRGAITPEEAKVVQGNLLTDSAYEGCFKPGTRHWEIGNPIIPAFAVTEETGKRMKFAQLQSEAAGAANVLPLIRRGHIAVFGSTGHFYTALRPEDSSDHLAIIDPLRPQSPTLYPLEDGAIRALTALEGSGQAVII
jgi:hypothetical protein